MCKRSEDAMEGISRTNNSATAEEEKRRGTNQMLLNRFKGVQEKRGPVVLQACSRRSRPPVPGWYGFAARGTSGTFLYCFLVMLGLAGQTHERESGSSESFTWTMYRTTTHTLRDVNGYSIFDYSENFDSKKIKIGT